MDPMVGSSVATDGSISDSSDNAALLDFCFLCTRQFFHEDLDNYDTQRLKDEDVLEIFFEELGPVDRALLQCCPSCQNLCKTLTRTKDTLSSLVDEITNLLLRSRKVSTLLPKNRILSQIFQPSPSHMPLSPCEVSSSYLQQPLSQINFSKDVSSNFSTQFNLKLDSSNLCVDDPLDLASSHSNISIIRKLPFISTDELCKKDELAGASCNSFGSVCNTESIMNSVSDNACDISEEVNIVKQAPTIFNIHIQKSSSSTSTKHCSKSKEENRTICSKSKEENRAICSKNTNKVSRRKEKVETKNTQMPETKSLWLPKKLPTEESQTTSDKKLSKNKCITCNVSFKTARNLNNHLSAHKQERKLICELCGARYRHKAGLDNHVAIHEGQSKFQCEICSKSFTQNIGLQRHLLIHKKKFQFVCDICGKQFLHHTSLTAHKLVHTGARNYNCTMCNASFVLKSNLQRHLKTHTGEKAHTCTLCDRSFSERYNLAAHLKSHDKESAVRHQCSNCPKSFTRKFKLQQHMKHIHGIVE